MADIEFRTAIRDALAEELDADESVIFYGEDVAEPGGVFAVTPELLERFGPDRVFDTPISELVMTGAAFGSAVCGLRPVLEIMFGDFLALSMDSLVNQAAKWWYVSGEQTSVPLTIRSATRFMCSAEATEDPPYFWTTRATGPQATDVCPVAGGCVPGGGGF